MEKKYKTTAKDFKLFRDACIEWIDRFGIGRWHHNFEHVELDGRVAQVGFSVGGRNTMFSLSKTWVGIKPTAKEIKKSAIHEVTHVLVGRLFDYAKSRNADMCEIEEEYEAISRSMERAIYGV